MKIAIVILNWNGQKLLAQFLPSVVEFTPEQIDIYLADNASTDNSIDFVRENFSRIKIVKNDTNLGYAGGYNAALQHIDADIYCLLNSDVAVTESWLTPVLEIFKKQENVAIIQPRLLDFREKDKFEYAGAGGAYVDFFGYPYCRGRLFNTLETDRGQFTDTISVFWASGACLFIRSKVYHQLEGFDQDYFAHQEEIDLCWRAQNQGYEIKYVGKSSVYHLGASTLQKKNPQKTFLNFRNNLLTILKNVPRRQLLFVLLSRLVLDGIAGVKFALELRPIHAWAIVKAHLSFYKNFFKFLGKRKKLQKKSNYSLHTSVVWQYFILRRRKFKDLK